MELFERLSEVICKRGLTFEKVADGMGLTLSDFLKKVRENKLGTKDAKLLCEMLKPENPSELFFAQR